MTLDVLFVSEILDIRNFGCEYGYPKILSYAIISQPINQL